MSILNYNCSIMGYRQSALGYAGGYPPPIKHPSSHDETERQRWDWDGVSTWNFTNEVDGILGISKPGFESDGGLGTRVSANRNLWYWTVNDPVAVGQPLWVNIRVGRPSGIFPNIPLAFYIQYGLISSPNFTNVLSGTNFYNETDNTLNPLVVTIRTINTGFVVPAMGTSVTITAVMDNDLTFPTGGMGHFENDWGTPSILWYGKG